MGHFVYILYSTKADRYYVGETCNLEERLKMHNSGFFKGSFTKQANDWNIVFSLECNDINIARRIELYIKKMKSRKYIENLIHSPDIIKSQFENF
ncbi:MAG TPA: GIY-YIG nuclease family protein [Bacteroidales bacterium]|nr:GIY-YIG nuclease family protein [Bacteroidales bacterium]HPS16976.1 GIY-YIG nuclease family protein [Bacteroidales bacterium]